MRIPRLITICLTLVWLAIAAPAASAIAPAHNPHQMKNECMYPHFGPWHPSLVTALGRENDCPVFTDVGTIANRYELGLSTLLAGRGGLAFGIKGWLIDAWEVSMTQSTVVLTDPGTVNDIKWVERANFHHRYCNTDYWISIEATFRTSWHHNETVLEKVRARVMNNRTRGLGIAVGALYVESDHQTLIEAGGPAGVPQLLVQQASLNQASYPALSSSADFYPGAHGAARAWNVLIQSNHFGAEWIDEYDVAGRKTACTPSAVDRIVFVAPNKPNPHQLGKIYEHNAAIWTNTTNKNAAEATVKKNIATINQNNKRMEHLALVMFDTDHRKREMDLAAFFRNNFADIHAKVKGHYDSFLYKGSSFCIMGGCWSIKRPPYINSKQSAGTWHQWADLAAAEGRKLPGGAANCWWDKQAELNNAWAWYSNVWPDANWYMWTVTTITDQCFTNQKIIYYAALIDRNKMEVEFKKWWSLHQEALAAPGEYNNLKFQNAALWGLNVDLQKKIADYYNVNIYLSTLARDATIRNLTFVPLGIDFGAV